MKKSYLDYYKVVLEKVSFDPYLFYKEYKKAINTINEEESAHLICWLREQGLYSELLPIKSANTFSRG